MFAVLRMEDIRSAIQVKLSDMGCRIGGFGGSRVWVAKITGYYSEIGFEREFLTPMKDYSDSNRLGNRGVYNCYFLEYGLLYEVSRPETQSRIDRYFCCFDECGKKNRFTRLEAQKWENFRLG